MRYLVALAVSVLLLSAVVACCSVARSGSPIVNADQTVVIIWNKATKEQHFIRKATFATKEQNFGFIIPSPSEPELAEARSEVFDYLSKWTEPEIIRKAASSGCGCSDKSPVKIDIVNSALSQPVTVLQEKSVAGYDAVVLEAVSGKALTEWLSKNGFEFSPEVAAWAQPYVDQKWKFTALKISTRKPESGRLKEAQSLRMSFKTDKPLFPYREPASSKFARELGQSNRLLRMYVLAENRYQGEISNSSWTGKAVWAGKVSPAQRTTLVENLKLDSSRVPASLYLTEFEDRWQYKEAAGDLYFAQAQDQQDIRRPAIYVSQEAGWGHLSTIALACVIILPIHWSRRQRGNHGCS